MIGFPFKSYKGDSLRVKGRDFFSGLPTSKYYLAQIQFINISLLLFLCINPSKPHLMNINVLTQTLKTHKLPHFTLFDTVPP